MTPADMIAIVVLSERRSIDRGLEHAGVATGDRDDLAQEVALLAVQAAQHDRIAWRRRGTLTRWLYVVALRHGRAHVQRAEVRARYEGTHENEPIVPSAEDRYLVREALALAARSTTPERWRTLRAWASGIDVADIAYREGLTVPGVYSRIERARRDIRAIFRRC